jgi:hypothetical protein
LGCRGGAQGGGFTGTISPLGGDPTFSGETLGQGGESSVAVTLLGWPSLYVGQCAWGGQEPASANLVLCRGPSLPRSLPPPSSCCRQERGVVVYDAIAVEGAPKEVVEYGSRSPMPRTSDQTGVTSSPEPERSSAEPDDDISSPQKKPSPPKKDLEALQARNIERNNAEMERLGLEPLVKPTAKQTKPRTTKQTPQGEANEREQVPCYITLTLHWCYTWCYTWCNTHRWAARRGHPQLAQVARNPLSMHQGGVRI